MDQGLSNLLQWSIENSANGQANQPTGVALSQNGTDGAAAQPATGQQTNHASRGLNQDALRALMGGPSDADLMKEAMTVIVHPDADHDAKVTAFDNLEQLIENLDNANNLAPLGLWPPLLEQLKSGNAELRKMAAWCVGTAVQNNPKCQQYLLEAGGIKTVAAMSLNDPDPTTRRKAVYALSSSIRNFQPGMDQALTVLPKNITGPDHVSAADMDVIDAIMGKLREN